jgi:hypothetical protein
MRISVACVVTLLVSCSCALNFGGWAPEMPLKGTQDAFVGLSVALSSKYAVVGVPQGRIYGYVFQRLEFQESILARFLVTKRKI